MNDRLKEDVLSAIDPNGSFPTDVRQKVMLLGYAESEIRSAIANLWDQGYVNLSHQRKLYKVI